MAERGGVPEAGSGQHGGGPGLILGRLTTFLCSLDVGMPSRYMYFRTVYGEQKDSWN